MIYLRQRRPRAEPGPQAEKGGEQCAEVITKNAVRLTLRGHEPTILILRQNGRVDQIPEAALFEEAV